MQRRNLLGFTITVLALFAGGCTTPGVSTLPPATGGVVVQNGPRGTTVSAGITVGQARELAVAHRLTGFARLPPGIQRNLARGRPLPPGIARRALPDAMMRSLPAIQGHEWRVAGTDLVLVAIGTLVVAEILDEVFR